MLIVFVYLDKNFAIEIEGETFNDVKTILIEDYGLNFDLSFYIDSVAIPDKKYFEPIQKFPDIQDYTEVIIKKNKTDNQFYINEF